VPPAAFDPGALPSSSFAGSAVPCDLAGGEPILSATAAPSAASHDSLAVTLTLLR
jgi:hypothetical protein